MPPKKYRVYLLIELVVGASWFDPRPCYPPDVHPLFEKIYLISSICPSLMINILSFITN